jgi:predicted TIM-barrel fold metal-dependent hydrolase
MDNKIIDFHVHAFPDELATRAMRKLLEEAPEARAHLDGTVRELLRSMDRCGIEKCVLSCIATQPKQFEPIFDWCRQIRGERVIPFPSVHPADEAAAKRVEQIKTEGFAGVKFHPYYQDFRLDEKRMEPIYDKASELGLMVVVHTGYDIAFAYDRRADCERILKVAQRWPDLKFIATHLGAWRMWNEVREQFIGKQVYTEISMALEELERHTARDMLMLHPADYILFGTDSPWTDQGQTLKLLQDLDLPQERMEKILYSNAARLLTGD